MDNKISRKGLFSTIPSILKENLDSRDLHLDIKEVKKLINSEQIMYKHSKFTLTPK
jgi:hypothetical protein